MTRWERAAPIAAGVLTIIWGIVSVGRLPMAPSIAWVAWVVLMFYYQGRINDLLIQRAIEDERADSRVEAPVVIPATLRCRYYAVLFAPVIAGVIDWLDVIPH